MLLPLIPSEQVKQHSCSTHRGQLLNVDWIRAVPFVNDNKTIKSLKDEIPAYLVLVGNIPDNFDALADTWQWWRNNAVGITSWASAVKKIALVQPSSVATERVFLLLVTMFGGEQHDAQC